MSGGRGFSLLDLFSKLGGRAYDWMYSRGAPWESGPRHELVGLVESGRLSPNDPGPRALDVGCGSGADSVFLAERGFDVTGIDFSRVALDKAESLATRLPPEQRPRFVHADLLAVDLEGSFDLIFDGGTVDDFPVRDRFEVARILTNLSRPGSKLVMWCFHGSPSEFPRFSLRGPSRWGAPAVYEGEESQLFGEHWEIDRLPEPSPGSGAACFLMARR